MKNTEIDLLQSLYKSASLLMLAEEENTSQVDVPPSLLKIIGRYHRAADESYVTRKESIENRAFICCINSKKAPHIKFANYLLLQSTRCRMRFCTVNLHENPD